MKCSFGESARYCFNILIHMSLLKIFQHRTEKEVFHIAQCKSLGAQYQINQWGCGALWEGEEDHCPTIQGTEVKMDCL